MSSFKNIAWSGSAVVLALLMSLVLTVQTASAAVTTTTVGATAFPLWQNGTNGTGAGMVLTTQPVITAAVAATDIPAGTVVLVKTPVGWSFTAQGTATGSTTAAIFGVGNVGVLSADAKTITYTTTANNAAGETVTWAGLAVRADSNTSAVGAVTIQIGAGAAMTLANLTTTAPMNASNLWVLTLTAPNTVLPADGSVGVLVTATLTDGGTPARIVSGVPISWTVSLGILGTGTSKTALSVTGNAGTTTQTYRGGGGQVSTDTIIATNSTYSLVATLPMSLIAASGTTASKVVFQAPTVLAVAANVTNTQPNYVSPTTGTTVSAQVQDSSGLGVNNQQVLITVDKGAIYLNTATGLGANVIAAPNCAGQTSKSVTGPTTTQSQANGGNTVAGTINIVYCGSQTDAPGKATLTVQNITTTMANATTSLSMAGRPAKLEPTTTGAAISVKVSDAGGNAVADGTPVRFTISANAGAVSTACTTTTNGAASAVAALIASSGLVIISTDWNETGAAATCGAAGAQQIASSINVSGGTASTGGTGTGTGLLVSGSIPASGFGLIVFGGGTIAQLVTASGVGNTGALYATVGGIFVPYVPGTTISAVNADFLAAFPGGNIPANTAFVGRK